MSRAGRQDRREFIRQVTLKWIVELLKARLKTRFIVRDEATSLKFLVF
jgi:hypothetical protein